MIFDIIDSLCIIDFSTVIFFFIGTVIVYKFSDLNCTNEASFDTYSTGCSNTANNDLAQSQYLQCIRSNSLPVAKGTFIVERYSNIVML